jgi:hypothetical protein
MKDVIFWDVTPYASCKNTRFGGKYRHPSGGEKIQRVRNVSNS